MDGIKIASINIHGLRNRIKRKTFFHKMKTMKYDIICVQESYISEEDLNGWKREWGGEIYFSTGTNHSMGQLILLRKHFPHNVTCTTKLDRLLAIDIDLEDGKLHVANVYAPNDSARKKVFFRLIEKHILENNSDRKIVCGDFNCVISNELDIISGGKHNPQEVELLNEIVLNCELNDMWRVSHPQDKEYSWSGRTPFIARRLDYMFVNDLVLDKTVECEFHSVPQSDHRLMEMQLNLTHIKRGPSYWKFNDSLLHDKKTLLNQ